MLLERLHQQKRGRHHKCFIIKYLLVCEGSSYVALVGELTISNYLDNLKMFASVFREVPNEKMLIRYGQCPYGGPPPLLEAKASLWFTPVC